MPPGLALVTVTKVTVPPNWVRTVGLAVFSIVTLVDDIEHHRVRTQDLRLIKGVQVAHARAVGERGSGLIASDVCDQHLVFQQVLLAVRVGDRS